MDAMLQEPIVHEWGSFLIRWLHVIAAMAWIGASFYFMHLDAHIRPAAGIPEGEGGQAWEVHGGGFYQVRKWLVAPRTLPEHLIWHKWQSYTTWLSGFALLFWVYYLRADLYLIDPSVREITPWVASVIGMGGLLIGWLVYDGLCRSPLGNHELALSVAVFLFLMLTAFGFQQVFSARAAMLHTGAVIATWMTANVFFLIMPNQRKTIAALSAARAPDPAWGKQAKTRSTHNNYLTLPVIFLMLSGHYPLAWSTPYAWVIVGLIVVTGGVVRHFFNVRNAGGRDPWWAWVVAAACVVLVVAISVATSPGINLTAAPEQRGGVTLAATMPPDDVVRILNVRCSMCHAPEPLWPGIPVAPRGVMLDTPEHIARFAPAIREQAVLSWAMPPNNITAIEPEERAEVAKWLENRPASP